MKKEKYTSYLFFRIICIILLAFGLLLSGPSAVKLYKNKFIYTDKVVATSSFIDTKVYMNEDTGEAYYDLVYQGTYHNRKVTFKDTNYIITEELKDKTNQTKTFWVNPKNPKDYTDKKLRFDTYFLIGIFLSVTSTVYLYCFKKEDS